MAENSSIEWTDHTFNPWRGCQKVSPGCQNCYAETLSHRNPGTLGEWGPPHATERVIAAESYWRQPVKWNRQAEAEGVRRRVFCASLADVFEDAPQVFNARVRLFDLIECTPALDWLLLTKRPENVRGMAPERWNLAGWPANVWLGTSVEDQERADERIPLLLEVPARVRFLSMEPLLGPVDLTRWLCSCARDHEHGHQLSCSGGRWCLDHFRAHATPKTPTGCGTDAGYAAHRRAGTSPCAACRDAHAEAHRQRRTETAA